MKKVNTYIPYYGYIELVSYYTNFLEYYPYCELQTKKWFVENIQDEWTILDVGANIGYYSILFSKLAKNGKVFSFEPTSTFDKLKENINFHSCNNVELIQQALGNSKGEVIDKIFQIWGNEAKEEKYSFNTIDNFIQERNFQKLDCIKIDVDSFDFEVLQGAENTILKFNPWIVVELNHALAKRNQNVNMVLEWLYSKGYNSAFITDHENYIFKRNNSNLNSFQLNFDSNPILLPNSYEKKTFIQKIDHTKWKQDVSNLTHYKEFTEFEFNLPQWSYIAYIELPTLNEKEFIIDFTLFSNETDIGIGVVKKDFQTYLSNELFIYKSEDTNQISIYSNSTESCYLIIRTINSFKTNSKIKLYDINLFSAQVNPETEREKRKELQTKVFNLNEIEKLLNTKSNNTSIKILDYNDLNLFIQNPKKPFSFPNKVLNYSLSDFKMYRDDSKILEFFISNIAPKKHLEFGTWEGFGSLLVAKNSNSEIWTINLEEGEFTDSGSSLYSNTDNKNSVGWMFKNTEFSERIHQIFSNSLSLKKDYFPDDSFDTILIDGGHTEEVVKNDTELAIKWLKKGGYVFWHDFCIDQHTIKTRDSVVGVLKAFINNFKEWSNHFENFYWIRPSWILIARKK